MVMPALTVVERMHMIDKSRYIHVLRQACRSARENAGTEICGLIVDNPACRRRGCPEWNREVADPP